MEGKGLKCSYSRRQSGTPIEREGGSGQCCWAGFVHCPLSWYVRETRWAAAMGKCRPNGTSIPCFTSHPASSRDAAAGNEFPNNHPPSLRYSFSCDSSRNGRVVSISECVLEVREGCLGRGVTVNCDSSIACLQTSDPS